VHYVTFFGQRCLRFRSRTQVFSILRECRCAPSSTMRISFLYHIGSFAVWRGVEYGLVHASSPCTGGVRRQLEICGSWNQNRKSACAPLSRRSIVYSTLRAAQLSYACDSAESQRKYSIPAILHKRIADFMPTNSHRCASRENHGVSNCRLQLHGEATLSARRLQRETVLNAPGKNPLMGPMSILPCPRPPGGPKTAIHLAEPSEPSPIYLACDPFPSPPTA